VTDAPALPTPKPLKAQRGALGAALVIYVVWVAFLAWVYFGQMKP